MKKTLPFTREELQTMIDQYPTPFYIYDEQAIRANARAFNEAFADFPAFQEYFAVKAAPTPGLLELFREEGCGVDLCGFERL